MEITLDDDRRHDVAYSDVWQRELGRLEDGLQLLQGDVAPLGALRIT